MWPHGLDQVRPAYASAVKSLRDLDYMDKKKAQVGLAVSKWLEIISLDWSSSSVGSQLQTDMFSDPTGRRPSGRSLE